MTATRTFVVGNPPIAVNDVDNVNYTATLTTPQNPLVTLYTWDFGDGSAPASGPTLTSVSHSWTELKTYNVTLTATTTQGNNVTSTRQVAFRHTPTDVYAGTLSSSLTWDVDGNPYRVHGIVTIPAGVRLTLQPGVILQFDEQAGLNVNGELVSNGLASSSRRVYLTSSLDNSCPGLGGTDQGGSWRGLSFGSGTTANLTGVVVRHANTGVTGSPSLVANATFDRCANGIYLEGSTSTPPDVAITNNTFTGSGLEQAVTLNYSFGTVQISGNKGLAGTAKVRFLHSAILTKDSTFAKQENIVYEVTPPSYSEYSLTVAQGATMTMEAGSVWQFHYNTRLQVNGTLRSTGTAANPAILTHVSDDSPYGGEDTTGSNRWRGLSYGSGTTANLQGLFVRYASTGVGGSPTLVTNGTFDRCSQGIYTTTGGGVVTATNFLGNTYGIFNSSTLDVDARGNWWGDASGPYHPTKNPNGKGNRVSDYVIIEPWLPKPIDGDINMLDVMQALKVAAGLTSAMDDDLTRLNVEKADTSAGRIDMRDASRLMRDVAGTN